MDSHSHHHHHNAAVKVSNERLAVKATFHCLLGCGIGEVVGMIISTAIGLSNLNSTILSIVLGFVAGLALGIVPLMKVNFTIGNALKTVIIAEGLSIAVMEAFEVFTQIMIPGVMTAHLDDAIFWIGMIASLLVGFIAALPVNFIMIRRGIRHQH